MEAPPSAEKPGVFCFFPLNAAHRHPYRRGPLLAVLNRRFGGIRYPVLKRFWTPAYAGVMACS